ncbi:hypothetical protein VTL71DRAFT_3633 [Oculimacula yallundae]|uniref:Uncharacterized protein n=1 Tax=Oculimacula yallundae TaxID=86028 RepID=A0ABR4C9X2_9HELO
MADHRGPWASSPKGEEDIQRSITEIFDLERDPSTPFSLVQGYQETEHTSAQGPEGQVAKTAYLKHILPVAVHLWQSGSSLLDLTAEKLADASREARWRIPIGDSGFLDFFLEILPTCDNRKILLLHTLRLIGNACADVDSNRVKCLSRNSLDCIIHHLKDPVLSTVVIVVIYNVCLDFEPAQRVASECKLTRELIEHLSARNYHEKEFRGHCCDILALLATQDVELEHAPPTTGLSLLTSAAAAGIEENLSDFSSLLTAAMLYLPNKAFQKAMLEQDGMATALRLVTKDYAHLQRHEGSSNYFYTPSTNLRDLKDQTLTHLSALGQVLLDISTLPEFSTTLYPLTSPFGASLLQLLESPRMDFQNYACVLIGNLARSDSVSEELVHTYQIHKLLISILKTTQDAKLLFAALALLNNLALVPKNKVELGNIGLLEFLPTLWVCTEKIAVQHASIRLTRSLLIGNWDNVRRFYRRLSRDKDSPSHTRSNMSLLLGIFNRTENEATKIEISRLITTFCRVGSQRLPNDALKLEQNKKKFFSMHQELGKPLIFMIAQQVSGIVRSEGWFTLALLAGTPEGASCILGVLSEDGGMQALTETLRGRSILEAGQPNTPDWPQWADPFMGEGWDWGLSKQPATPLENTQAMKMADLDRKNAKTILRVLIDSESVEIDPLQLSMYEDLLNNAFS